MDKYKSVKTKNDVIVRLSDFIIEHGESETFDNHYQLENIESPLGEGSSGKVFLCSKINSPN